MIPIVLTEASSNCRIVSPTIVQTRPKTSQSHHMRDRPFRTSAPGSVAELSMLPLSVATRRVAGSVGQI